MAAALVSLRRAGPPLERVRDRPFFLWLHLISPHADYAPPPPCDTFTAPGASAVGGGLQELVAARERGVALTAGDVAQVVSLYDGEVAYVDAQLGRVLDALSGLGLEERTLLVFGSDHGEDLNEHNRYFFHSPSMYSSSLQVPLIVALPGVLPRGGETDHPASLVDVAAWRRRDLREGAAEAGPAIDPATAEELRALGYIVS